LPFEKLNLIHLETGLHLDAENLGFSKKFSFVLSEH